MEKKSAKKIGKTIFKILSILFILGCMGYYGYRLVHYYKIYSTNSSWEDVEVILLSNKIINNSYINGDLSKLDDGFVYNYEKSNNYVKYSGMLWRVEKIESDGRIRLVATNTASNLANSASFSESPISKYLNDEESIIYRNLSNPDAYLVKTEVCTDEVSDLENITCDDVKEFLVGIPSINDYYIAGGIDGYIGAETEFWLSNTLEKAQYYINADGEVKKTKVIHNYEILPIITISNEVPYNGGSGTIEDPYIIGEKVPDTLGSKGLNERVSFNNQVWKIIDQDSIGTKIVLDGVLDEKRVFETKYKNVFAESVIYKYLNNEYYESIEDKDKIVEGTWYVGVYTSNNDFDYKSIYDNKITAKVGLLNMNDISLRDYNSVMTLTPSDSSAYVIYSVSTDGQINADYSVKSQNIRPVVYLDSNIKVIDGDGSKDKPYEME